MNGLGVDLELERELVVDARTELVPGIVALTLRDPAGGELPQWQPGSHIDLVLGDDLVRQFSLCGDPADRSAFRVAVLREDDGRGGSVAVHETLRPGTTVRSRGPRNHFAFEIAPRYRFIAGGIGITPILPMVRAAAAAGAEWSLAYAGKSAGGMAFAEELAAEFPERVRVFESATTGRMDVTAELADPDGVTDIYCCGPEALMGAVELAAAEAGWPAGALHLERFVPRELGEPVWKESFLVDLLLSGHTVTVDPGQSVLDAVRGTGALVLSSCEEGTCGTCETPLLEGAVEHRDSLLTPEEQAAGDRMMICVSRAACPRIVLEL
ncbi:MAG: PDR/VanB family oxidoreductase [Solirubrobacteraceae bacterium]